jgi:hypothetical protein
MFMALFDESIEFNRSCSKENVIILRDVGMKRSDYAAEYRNAVIFELVRRKLG